VIRMSAGTAACLGLKTIKMDVHPTTAYLLLGDSCTMKCSFCPQGKESSGAAGRLGRVTWPSFSLPELEQGLEKAEESGIKRICLQGVRNELSTAAFPALVKKLKEISSLPVCTSAWIKDENEAAHLFESGADRVSIALDAASEEAYKQFKGGSLAQRKELLISCARRWPGRISTHLICGLGETEQELLALTAELLMEQVAVALFAFTPLKGTALAGQPPPEAGKYRRIQAASYLLRKKHLSFSQLVFGENGSLESLGVTPEMLLNLLKGKEAFCTSGCPDCNRPYYNERPGGFIYNFPRLLTEPEEREALGLITASLQEVKRNAGSMAANL